VGSIEYMAELNKIRIGIIFGGQSGEHEVSLMSARSVLAALNPDKYEIHQIGITQEGAWFTGENVLEAFTSNQLDNLDRASISPDPTLRGLRLVDESDIRERTQAALPLDVVFPVLHGTYGEDGTLQGLLEMAGIPYVGAGVLGSALCMDKGVFQDVMVANGIPVLETLVVLRSEMNADMDGLLAKIERTAAGWTARPEFASQDASSYPLFIKPANLGSSVGISKCRNRSDLVEGLIEASRYDRRIIVQRGINAREIEVSVLGNDKPQASIPGEIIPSREFYSYEAKYLDNTSQLLIPAPLSFEISEEARALAIRAYRVTDCSGMARVDFLLEKETGKLYVSEINTIPGFTKISMYPKLWEASGLSYPGLLDRLVELALERQADKERTEHRFHTG